ncbi:hypothetical protein N9L68_00160 [bacterium]|nr:hypothetical protein [bacterium]
MLLLIVIKVIISQLLSLLVRLIGPKGTLRIPLRDQVHDIDCNAARCGDDGDAAHDDADVMTMLQNPITS